MGTIVRSLIFDLDGTLVDSRPGILDSLRRAVQGVFPDLETDSLVFQVGPPVREIMQAALGVRDEENLAALELMFRESYDKHGWKSVSLYPGIKETLAYLRRKRIRLFIVTNKPKLPTGLILEKLGLTEYFEYSLSRDSYQPAFHDKNSMLSWLFREYDIAEEESAYLGDSFEDLVAANLYKIRFIGIGYGYGSFSSTGQDFPILASFSELRNMI